MFSRQRRATIAFSCLLAAGLSLQAAPVEAGPRIVSSGSSNAADESPDAEAAEPPIAPDVAPDGPASTATASTSTSSEDAVPDDPLGLEMGIGGLFAVVSDDWISGEAAMLGGWTLPMRWRFSQTLAATVSLGGLFREAENEDLHESQVLIDLGAQYYYLQSRVIEPWISAGFAMRGGFVHHEGRESEYTELGGYVGVGMDIVAGHWRFVIDAQTNLLSRDDDSGPIRPRAEYTRSARDFRTSTTLGFTTMYHF